MISWSRAEEASEFGGRFVRVTGSPCCDSAGVLEPNRQAQLQGVFSLQHPGHDPAPLQHLSRLASRKLQKAGLLMVGLA